MVAKATRVYDAHGIEDGEDNRIFSKSILVMTRNVCFELFDPLNANHTCQVMNISEIVSRWRNLSVVLLTPRDGDTIVRIR